MKAETYSRIREMVAYVMDTKDDEIIDNYAETFYDIFKEGKPIKPIEMTKTKEYYEGLKSEESKVVSLITSNLALEDVEEMVEHCSEYFKKDLKDVFLDQLKTLKL